LLLEAYWSHLKPHLDLLHLSRLPHTLRILHSDIIQVEQGSRAIDVGRGHGPRTPAPTSTSRLQHMAFTWDLCTRRVSSHDAATFT
jgi:hypothetical protein